MLKVVGASWLQTRISTYILVAVALLGIGAIILGEFGHVEKDGTYSATVSWNHKGGYRIDFWGQSNDLTAVPLNAARAYYKTGIYESGWSIIEIETSAKYPDTVQAYAAGFLEGSLTWQLIHHHWYNTVYGICKEKREECRKLMRYLRENAAVVRERAELLETTDPFWHMVRLFYTQLDGLEAGWKFAVRRSRQSVEMGSEDFLWLAMASDLPDLEQMLNDSDLQIDSKGMIFLKALSRNNMEPLVTIGHNTAASYTRMLRLLKKYTFGYHIFPTTETATLIPSRSVIMSSYPGALSSRDEYYLALGENRELIITGMPLAVANRNLWSILNPKEQVMSSVRIMVANRLATDGRTWSRIVAFQNSGTSMRQWVTYEPETSNVWLIEQLLGITHAADYTEKFQETGFLSCTGVPHFREIKNAVQLTTEDGVLRKNQIARLQENITTMEDVRNLMRGYSHEDLIEENSKEISNADLSQILAYRGDIDEIPSPAGVIDTKIIVATVDGLETFEATSGPISSKLIEPFKWSTTFPNISHIGHPDSFNFDSVTPIWVWI